MFRARRDDPAFDFSGPAVEYAKAVETALSAVLFPPLRRLLKWKPPAEREVRVDGRRLDLGGAVPHQSLGAVCDWLLDGVLSGYSVAPGRCRWCPDGPARRRAARHRATKDPELPPGADHPRGEAKARFFRALGFDRERPWELIEELRVLVTEGEVSGPIAGPHGTKYVVDGILRDAAVRTVWIVDPPGSGVRFVTAYPLRRRR